MIGAFFILDPRDLFCVRHRSCLTDNSYFNLPWIRHFRLDTVRDISSEYFRLRIRDFLTLHDDT